MNTTVVSNSVIPGASYFAPGFQLAHPSEYSLYMLITPVQLVYVIEEAASKKVVALQPFQFSKIAGPHEWNHAIDSILETNSFLKRDFSVKKIGIFTPCMTLIPGQLYDENRRRELLSFNASIDENDSIFSDKISGSNIQLIYAIPNNIFHTLTGKLRGAEIHHSFSSLIRFLTNISDHGKHRMFAYVQPTSFQLIHIREKSLRFFNSFNYQSPEDFIYYLLFVCRQLHLEPEKMTLTLMGEIMRDSAIYQLTYKYVRELEFVGFHSEWQFSDDYPFPGQFFFNLFCLNK